MMAAQAAAGWLSDRVGRRAVVVPGLLTAALAMAGLGRAQTDVGLLAAGAGLGLSWGLVRAGLDAAVVNAVPQQVRGTALALFYTCFDIGVGAGSFGLGLIAQELGFPSAFYVSVGWAVVALAAYVTGGRSQSSGGHGRPSEAG
jgi:MFS family permease